ncbi:ABC transporter permease [Ancylobacter sp. VNQ12]|uniref:ABC transporter permease n=1 Tax=Ancylobacter sp. VNQ12 TaxID=3400920 RepID=UPI003C1158DC
MTKTSSGERLLPASGAPAAPAVRQGGSQAPLAYLARFGLLGALLVLMAVLSVVAENFLTLSNLMNILLQASNIGIMAAGLTLVVICAEIDLSVASAQTLGAVIVAALMVRFDVPIPVAIIVTLLAGLAIGSLSGLFVGTLGIPAFIVTLAMDSLLRGTSLILTGETSIFGLPDAFAFLGQGYVGPVPVAAIICGFVFLAVHLLLSHTVLGTNIYAVGGNKEAARIAGVNIFRVKLIVLAISGFCGTLAGIVMASRLMAAQAIMGLFDLMDVIAAVVIGGTSLLGGEGRIIGTIIGTLTIACIRNGLNLMGIPADWQLIAVGVIIMLAVLSDYAGRRAAQ